MLSSMYLGMGAISAILSVMSALLIALGIGQLRYRAWAAVWSVRWGVVALGAVVVMAILMTVDDALDDRLDRRRRPTAAPTRPRHAASAPSSASSTRR